MSYIHPTAITEGATIGENCRIGAYAVLKSGCVIGNGTIVHEHVVIGENVTIGENTEIFPFTLLGKEPKGAGALARQPVFEKRITIGDSCAIGPSAILFYDVTIGSNTLIGDGASIREKCTVGSKCIISRYVTVNYNTTIGNRTKVMDGTHITGNCTIGDDVFVSLLVGSANDNHIGQAGYDDDRVKGPQIHNGAAIGAGAMLLPNTIIGEKALVAAGAVVTKNVEAGTVVAGVPAKPRA
ncbi:MAG: transferase [Blastochloris viridis]|uniref:Transferase n=1 Tax=Blastochloris viridis TaxID=1079 RepID=A0A6N4RDS3_BLAVI|nr:MAG: transferase [Blastochloris viridis]